MKKIIVLLSLFISGFSFAQEQISLTSINESLDYAKFKIQSQSLDLSQGFTIEVANSDCEGISDSMFLSTPKVYSSAEGTNFVKLSNTDYEFVTPFSVTDLNSKWFKWRVVAGSEVSSWKCFSWSDYCEVFLTAEGKCK